MCLFTFVKTAITFSGHPFLKVVISLSPNLICSSVCFGYIHQVLFAANCDIVQDSIVYYNIVFVEQDFILHLNLGEIFEVVESIICVGFVILPASQCFKISFVAQIS